MAKNGITALTKSLAAIYYLPFQCVFGVPSPEPLWELNGVL